MNTKIKVEVVNNAKVYTVQAPSLTYDETAYTEDELKARLQTLKKQQKEKLNELEVIEAEIEAIKDTI